MSSAHLYDTIGAAYTVTRRTEPRIAAKIWAALGDALTVLNVGAGTGSYEPPSRDVTAVEPSALMCAQRPAGAAPCVAAVAESLPFEDQSFDAAMAVATVHHWRDPIAAAPAALAAAPSNDTFGGATTATIGFSQVLDTTQATTDSDDAQLNASCGAPATDASVWYSLAGTDAGVVVDVSR